MGAACRCGKKSGALDRPGNENKD